MANLSRAQRRAVMTAFKGKATKPEMAVLQYLESHGYRYRVHPRDLPGMPNFILLDYKVAIQVRGCFWHSHSGCTSARIPGSNIDYWIPRLRANAIRDKANDKKLARAGWRVIVIWAC